MPLNPSLRRQRQADLCDFEASLIYIVSSRSHTTTKSCLKKKKIVIKIKIKPRKGLEAKGSYGVMSQSGETWTSTLRRQQGKKSQSIHHRDTFWGWSYRFRSGPLTEPGAPGSSPSTQHGITDVRRALVLSKCWNLGLQAGTAHFAQSPPALLYCCVCVCCCCCCLGRGDRVSACKSDSELWWPQRQRSTRLCWD